MAEMLEIAARNCPGEWHVILVDDPGTISSAAMVLGLRVLGEAPLMAVVVAPKDAESEALRASVYMEIAARFLGLSPIWAPGRGLEDLLGVPPGMVCVAAVGVGKAGNTTPLQTSWSTQRMHFNRYGEHSSPSMLLQGLLKAKGLA